MEGDEGDDDDDWQDDDVEGEEEEQVPKRSLVAQSDWTHSGSSEDDDADGQTATGNPYDPYNSIIVAVNVHDTKKYRDCTAPKYKVAHRNKAKGLLLMCHTCFEQRIGTNGIKRWVLKQRKFWTCFFRVQARYTKKSKCLISGNSRNRGAGPINLMHTCATPTLIQEAEHNNATIDTQRKRNTKTKVLQGEGGSVQMENHSKGTHESSSKHVRFHYFIY